MALSLPVSHDLSEPPPHRSQSSLDTLIGGDEGRVAGTRDGQNRNPTALSRTTDWCLVYLSIGNEGEGFQRSLSWGLIPSFSTKHQSD